MDAPSIDISVYIQLASNDAYNLNIALSSPFFIAVRNNAGLLSKLLYFSAQVRVTARAIKPL